MSISTPTRHTSSSSSGCMSLVWSWSWSLSGAGAEAGAGAGVWELERASCLAAVVELRQGLGQEEGCDNHGDSYTHKGNEALCPHGQGVILLHHWPA